MKHSRPAVSVLLPVRDALPHLQECLRSLSAQTLADFEVVAVDDGSTDGSAQLLEQAAKRDPRMRVLRRPHRGLVAALNLGLQQCRGEAVARMDADDVAHPKRLELQTAALQRQPDLAVVSCLVSHFASEAVTQGFRIYEEWLNSLLDHEQIMRERFIESPLAHPSVMVRRRALERCGGYRDCGWPEDYDLWLRLAAGGARFSKVRRTLLKWRDHPGRLTRCDPRYAVERFLECKAAHLAEGPLRGKRVILWGAGKTGRRISKHLLRRSVPLAAFIDIHDSKIGRTLRGAPILAPEDLPRKLQGPEPPIVLSAVSSRGARALIRKRLSGLGLAEGADFWCVA